MESIGGSGFVVVGCTVRKKRSNVARRPRPDSQPHPDGYDLFPLSSTTTLGSGRNDENPNLGDSIIVSHRLGSENRPKKLKLKVGGVTHTVHTKPAFEIAFGGGSSATNSSYTSDAPRPRQELSLQDKGFQGIPLKEFSKSGSSVGKEYSSRGKMPGEGISLNETNQYESVRKSKRVPKRRIMDVGLNDDDEDEEIRYLGRLSTSKVAVEYKDEGEEGSERKQMRGISKVSESDQMDDDMYDMADNWSPRLGKDSRKKLRSEKIYEDKDYVDEEESTSDYEPNATRKKSRKESSDLFIEGRNELTLVTRKQALQSGKDVLSGSSLIDLPNGLPLVLPKKQKEKVTEVEQQLKKAEATQRRRMQADKAAREAEAEAIRKILGQDSGRKKREEKMKQQRDELAQRKAANNVSLASNTIRWVMGPTGTVVIFSEDIGLPSIFNSMPCSYPPPREKCVGPNCRNAYKYRDSKLKLPLCSLHCYRAIHKKMHPLIAC